MKQFKSEGPALARIEVEAADAHTLVLALFSALAAALDATPTGGMAQVGQEAERLFKEYCFLRGHNRKIEALKREASE